MFKHSLLFIYRSFKRSRSPFFINLIGLSSGLTCWLLIYLWTTDELGVDKYHRNDKRLFQVMENESDGKGIHTTGNTHHVMAEVLAATQPEIEYAVVVTPPSFFPAFTLGTPERHVKGVGKFVGKDFFHVFSYPILQGDASRALSGKNVIVLSEQLARKLFGTTQNILGKTLEWQFLQVKRQVKVSGVFQDVPSNSSAPFDFVLPFDLFGDIMGWGVETVNWSNQEPFYTYVTLREDADVNQFKARIGGLLASRKIQNRKLFLQRYSDNYLYGNYENGVQAGGRIVYVRLFSTIALFILAIACINFMNLFTAAASKRLKEVGIKKAIGAHRSTLVFQYLGESMIMSFLSLLIAVILAELLLPQFNGMTGKVLTFHFDARLITSALGITLLTGLAAGGYPAFYLSGFRPALVLKGKVSTSPGEAWARKGLVVFQFALSVIFIVAVVVVYQQIELIQTRSLGYDKDNVLYFETEGNVAKNTETFLSEIKRIPGVVNASSMLGGVIGEGERGGMPGAIKRNGKVIIMNNGAVNYDLLETLGIQMKEGRSFSRYLDADTLKKIIYNEAAIEALGITEPVGKIIDGREIIGVARNFNFESLHKAVAPFSFRLEPYYAMTVVVKVKAGKESETIAELEKYYKRFNPGYSFDFKFLDQTYEAQYVAEKRVSMLSRYFAGIAIIISCLGLFGLATFTAERRRKEISIRKILGSSETEIVYLLSGDFGKIIVYSIVIALPVSYFLTRQWLDTFAFRIDLRWWYFLCAGTSTLLVAMFTVGFQTLKAARANPVECLKEE